MVAVLTIVHTAVLVLVLTCEHHTAYYAEIGFKKEGPFPHLIHWHGAAYVAYMALVLCYAAVILAVCMYQYRMAKQEEKTKMLYLIIIVLCPVFGLVLYLSGLVYVNAPVLWLFPELNSRDYEKTIEVLREYCRDGKRLHKNTCVYIVSERDILLKAII